MRIKNERMTDERTEPTIDFHVLKKTGGPACVTVASVVRYSLFVHAYIRSFCVRCRSVRLFDWSSVMLVTYSTRTWRLFDPGPDTSSRPLPTDARIDAYCVRSFAHDAIDESTAGGDRHTGNEWYWRHTKGVSGCKQSRRTADPTSTTARDVRNGPRNGA